MYADIAIAGAGFKTYTYRIPETLISRLSPGAPVITGFHRSSVIGVVVKMSDKLPAKIKSVKNIQGVLDDGYRMSDSLLRLVNWIADYYICPSGDVFKASFPPGFIGKTRMRVIAGDSEPSDSQQKYVYEKVKEKAQGYLFSKTKPIIESIPNKLIIKLIESGNLKLLPDYYDKNPRGISVILPALDTITPELSSTLTKRRVELLETLANYPEGIALSNLQARGFSNSLIHSMAESGYLQSEKRYETGVRQPSKTKVQPLTLTIDQQSAAQTINDDIERGENRVHLLYGVTGSGKTQVYIEAARKALKLGKSVLILLPEISLTPQAIGRFTEALDQPIGLWHSRITAGQRAQLFRSANTGELKVILGVRSAVFTPLKTLGLIVVDEENDDSYKQSEPPPRYNARDVAIMRASFENAVVILGSATP